MALDATTLKDERRRWNDSGTDSNAIANFIQQLVDGSIKSNYASTLTYTLTPEHKAKIRAEVIKLRDAILARYQESEVKNL